MDLAVLALGIVMLAVGYGWGTIKKSNAVFQAQCDRTSDFIAALAELGYAGAAIDEINSLALGKSIEREQRRRAKR